MIIGLLIVGAGANARYIQGIDNGSFNVYKNDGQVIRQFTTTRDGFVNIVPSPPTCLEQMYLLDAQNQIVGKYDFFTKRLINERIRAGQYFIQMIPREDCKINIALPE